jgi:UDP-glucuronate 4-epimerase
MTVRDDRGDVKQTTTGFRGPLMVQSLTSAKSKFLSLDSSTSQAPWRVYNIGNNSPVELFDYIEAIEEALDIKAEKELLPLQPGDVPDTYADVDDLVKEFDYKPSMSVKQGVKNFVDWFKEYHNL